MLNQLTGDEDVYFEGLAQAIMTLYIDPTKPDATKSRDF
jgi:hypothetical protein